MLVALVIVLTRPTAVIAVVRMIGAVPVVRPLGVGFIVIVGVILPLVVMRAIIAMMAVIMLIMIMVMIMPGMVMPRTDMHVIIVFVQPLEQFLDRHRLVGQIHLLQHMRDHLFLLDRRADAQELLRVLAEELVDMLLLAREARGLL